MPSSTPDYSSWYDRLFPDLTGNGVWLAGNEFNTVDPREYGMKSFRVLIARLSTYFDTAESFSHKVLYQIVRKHGDMFPDLAYLPPLHDGPIFSRNNVPWLLGTQTKQGPRGFDLIAFSNAIVQELVNVPVMLERSGIPLKKSDRLADPAVPLVILGGSSSLYTSILFVPDPPLDGIFFGESTEAIARLFTLCAGAKQEGRSKTETLALLETIPGFVQPDAPKKTARRTDTTLSLNRLLTTAPLSNVDARYGAGNLMVSEGCPCFCSFCAESFCHKPYREEPAQAVLAAARDMKAGMGLDKIELYSFNFNMHSEFYEIVGGLAGLFQNIGLKSQRFDMISHDPDMLPFCLSAGKTSITCGLEGISSRMRRYLHKSLAEQDLRTSLEMILSSPIRELKIFLVATGSENPQDYEDFGELLRFIKERTGLSAATPGGPRIIFSVTPLVRFPWTPLEFDNAPQPEVLVPVIAAVKSLVLKNGFEFRVSSDVNDYLVSQILVRARDRTVYAAMCAALSATGFVYYRSVPSSFVRAFLRECELRQLPVHRLLSGCFPEDDNADLRRRPWLFFETGVSRQFVRAQAKAARDFIDDGFCLGSKGRTGSCKACGACGGGEGDALTKRAILAARTARPQPPLKRQAPHGVAVPLLVDIKEACRGLPRHAAAGAIAAGIMTLDPSFVPWYRGFSHSLLSEGRPSWTIGHDILTLLWHNDGIDPLRRALEDPLVLERVNRASGRWATLVAPWPTAPEAWRLSMLSPYLFRPNSYCLRRGLTHVLRKSENGYSLEFTKQALKKKLIERCEYHESPKGGAEVELTVTAKFDAAEFAREAFLLDNECDWVRIVIKARIELTP